MRSYLPWTEPLIRIHKLQGEKVQVQDKNWAFPQSRCQIVNTKADKESDTWCLLEPSLSILNWNGNNLFFTIWFTQYATFWRSIYFIGKQNVSNKKADICRVVMLKHFDCKLQLQVFCLHKLCTSASWHFCTVMSKLLDLCQTGWRQLVNSSFQVSDSHSN